MDVTSAVQAWVSGTANDGIVLSASPGSSISVNFDSKENGSTSHDPRSKSRSSVSARKGRRDLRGRKDLRDSRG